MHNTCSTSCGRFAIGVQVVATPSVRFWAEIQVAIRVIQTAQRCVLTRSSSVEGSKLRKNCWWINVKKWWFGGGRCLKKLEHAHSISFTWNLTWQETRYEILVRTDYTWEYYEGLFLQHCVANERAWCEVCLRFSLAPYCCKNRLPKIGLWR